MTSILAILLLAASMSIMAVRADDDDSGSPEQPATNPANVVFRTVQASNAAFPVPVPVTRQFVAAAPQPAPFQIRPFTFFSTAAPQPVLAPQTRFIRPAFTRFVQPAPLPVVTRVLSPIPAPQPAPVVATFQAVSPVAKPAEPEPFDPNPAYDYGYEISNGESSVFSGHKESRQNGEVVGEYRVLDPNGDLRITRYTAGAKGYNAEIEIQKGAGPVYQHHKVIRSEITPVAAPIPAPIPAPVVISTALRKEDDNSGEKVKHQTPARFVDANVLNLRPSTTFFSSAPAPQAPAPFTYFTLPASQLQQQAHSGFRFVTAAPQHFSPQFFAAPSPYQYLRAAPFSFSTSSVAPLAAAAPTAFAGPSGTSFTRITHADGTTVEY